MLKAAGFLALPCELRVAEVKGDAEGGGLLEERPGLGAGHFRLEERVDLGIVEQPARKERGQRELRIDHEVGAARCRLAHQADHALDHIRTRLVAGDGAELGGCDGDDPAHSLSSPDHGASYAPLSGAKPWTRRPRGCAAAGRSQRRNWPRPGSPSTVPSSHTTVPRESVVTGQPVTTRPS